MLDPKELLEDDFDSFDKFMEWLEISLQYEDRDDARESLLGAFNTFIKFKYFNHASLIITVINKNEDRWITN